MAVRPLPLPVWDRREHKLVHEFMDDATQTYESEPRKSARQWLESQPLYDWLVAAWQNSRWSARQIEPFVRKHRIAMEDYEPGPHRSFAEFFERRLRPGARRFSSNPSELAAFAEARYFGWRSISPEQQFPIKGVSLNAAEVLGSKRRARTFWDGPVLLARLSPVDYHHVHYPDDGTTTEEERLGDRLWTVNWHALQSKPDILLRNERQVHILDTGNFGRLAFVEVGALSVGRIAQVHPIERPFRRGDEKSVFKFGGSAIIVFGRAGTWTPSEDIVANTEKNTETLIRLGDVVAVRS